MLLRKKKEQNYTERHDPTYETDFVLSQLKETNCHCKIMSSEQPCSPSQLN